MTIQEGIEKAYEVFNYLRANKFRAKEMRPIRDNDSGTLNAFIYVEGKNPEDPYKIVESEGLESLMLSDPVMNWKGECIMEGIEPLSRAKIIIIYGEEPHLPRRVFTSRDVSNLIRNPGADEMIKTGVKN